MEKTVKKKYEENGVSVVFLARVNEEEEERMEYIVQLNNNSLYCCWLAGWSLGVKQIHTNEELYPNEKHIFEREGFYCFCSICRIFTIRYYFLKACNFQ